MERYHIFKLGLAILFYATYCIRPMLVNALRTRTPDLRPEDYLVFYQIKDGTPGVDFPILSQIPRTSFSCQNFESGYYADLDTDCQAFHICDGGRKISFLCPNGTIFEQSELICEWWFKVNCTNAPNLYHESAERLREDLARRKLQKKVYLNGQERKHGAVMRIDEPLSVNTKSDKIYEFSPRASNIITSNGNNRINVQAVRRRGDERNKVGQSSRGNTIPLPRELDEQKPRRFNDGQTGNYINNVDQGHTLKDYHVQFASTSSGLDTASSERHVQTRSTTPSSLNRISPSDLGENAFKNQLNGKRGSVKYKSGFGEQSLLSSEGKPVDKYDLEFPKHKSQISSEGTPELESTFAGSRAKEVGTRIDLAIPKETKLKSVGSLSKTDVLRTRIAPGESAELQEPQETAAFAKSSYNTIQPASRKFSTVNPYPNHRTTYSDLKQPSFPSTSFLGSIKSVTPQYITTQSINNGKPFVGSTVGVKIHGNKVSGSTLAPEVYTVTPQAYSTEKYLFSSTSQPIISTTYTPLFEEHTDTDSQTVVSTLQPSSLSSFSATSAPYSQDSPNQVGETLSTIRPFVSATASTVRLPFLEDSTSTIGETLFSTLQPVSPFNPSVYIPPLEGISGATIQPEASTLEPSSLTTVRPVVFEHTTKKAIDHATVYGTFPKSASTTPAPLSGVEIKFGNNVDKVSVQLAKSFGRETPKYSSTIIPGLKPDSIVHIGDLRNAIQSTTARSLPESLDGRAGIDSTRSSLLDTGKNGFVRISASQTGIRTSSTRAPINPDQRYPTVISSNEGTDKAVKQSTDISYPQTTIVEDGRGTTESTFGSLETQTSTTGDGTVEKTTTKSKYENLKYGSTVLPPLLTSDAFVHVSDFQRTATPIRGSPETGAANVNLEIDNVEKITVPSVDIFLNSIGSTLPPETRPFGKEAALVTNLANGFSQHGGAPASLLNLKDTTGVSKGSLAAGIGSTVKPLITAAISENFEGGITVIPGIGLRGEGTTPGSGLGQGSSTFVSTRTQVATDNLKATPSEGFLATGAGRIVEPSIKATSFIGSTETPDTSVLFEGTTQTLELSGTASPLVTPSTYLPVNGIKVTTGGFIGTGANGLVAPLAKDTATIPESSFQTNISSTGSLDEATSSTTVSDLNEPIARYSSTVIPPLLKTNAVVHIGDLRTTSTPVDSTFVSSIGADTLVQTTDFGKKFKSTPDSTSSSPLPNLKSFIQGANELKPVDELPKYGSSVIPPLLTSNAFVHVGDLQKGSKPIAGVAIDSTSKFNKPSVPSKGDSEGKRISVDIYVSQNIAESTVIPGVQSFATQSRLKSKPVDNVQYSNGGATSISSSAPPAIKIPSLSADKPFGTKIGGSADIGFYVTKNSIYDSTTPSPFSLASTENYVQSTLSVNVNPNSGSGEIKPIQQTSDVSKLESILGKDSFLGKPESQRPKPFQRPDNFLDGTDDSTEAADAATPAYVNYKISSARPFKLPDITPAPTLPTPFTTSSSKLSSVYENVDSMIDILKEITNVTDKDFSSETPRPGLIVPPSVGPQTLHTLAVYFANALDGIAAEREKLTGEELDPGSKKKLTSLLTQMTMYRYNELFKEKEADKEGEVLITEPPNDVLRGDDSENFIQTPALRDLAKNFSLALSSYLNDPEAFRKDLENLRPTEPPEIDLTEDITEEAGVPEEELLNFSDADSKSSFSPVSPTLPSPTPTWGFIIAPNPSGEYLDVKNSLNPDLHTADTQSFVPGFNSFGATIKDSGKGDADSKKELPEGHWTASPGATRLWQSTFSVNPAVVNNHFVITEPSIPEETEYHASYPSTLSSFEIPQTEIQYELRSLPKLSVNSTEVHGILIDFVNATKANHTNRLQRLLRKLNTTEDEFLNRMKEIESNPLTKRLILLLISECGANVTKDLDEPSSLSSSKEVLNSSNSNSAAASLNQGGHLANSDIPGLVDPSLQEDDQDARALQLLNTLYSIASKFGK